MSKLSKGAAKWWLLEQASVDIRNTDVSEVLEDAFGEGDVDQDEWDEVRRQVAAIHGSSLPDTTAADIQARFEALAASPGPTRDQVTQVKGGDEPPPAPRPPALPPPMPAPQPPQTPPAARAKRGKNLLAVVAVALAVIMTVFIVSQVLKEMKKKTANAPVATSSALTTRKQAPPPAPPEPTEIVQPEEIPAPPAPAPEPPPMPLADAIEVTCMVTSMIVRSCVAPQGCAVDTRGNRVEATCGETQYRAFTPSAGLPRGEQAIRLQKLES